MHWKKQGETDGKKYLWNDPNQSRLESKLGAKWYIGETWIRVMTDEGNQQLGTNQLEKWVYLMQKCYFNIKRFGNARSGVNLSWNEFNKNVVKTDQQC